MFNRDSLLIFLIGVVVFSISLSPEITGFDCRFAMFAQEMLRNGPTFFPTTYGRPYPDYPGASTFMIYLASLPFGRVTPFSAVLPIAVVSALILVIIYRLGAIHSRQWGLFAVLITLFTKEFLSRSRSLTPDQYVSLATALSFYLVYSADVYGRKKRLWFIPLVLVLSFAFRGPIGIVVPAAVVCAYYLFNKNFKLFTLMAFAASVLFVLCFKALLIAAVYQGGTDFPGRVWEMQMAGRIGQSRHWLGYYWTNSFAKYAIAYPLAVIVAVSLFKKILRKENADYKFLGYLLLWMVVVLIGMSIPGTKKMRYIVPVAPAAALIASYMFICPFQNGVLSGLKEIFLKFCKWFPAGTAIAAFIVWVFGTQIVAFSTRLFGENSVLLLDGYYLVAIFLTVVLTTVVCGINAGLKKGFLHDLVSLTAGAATFIIIVVCIEEPISCSRNCTRPFVEKVKMLQNQKQGVIVFYKITADGGAIKFMINLDKPVEPQFINSAGAILNCKEHAYFIAKDRDYADLPNDVAQQVRFLAGGKISGDDCVVFTSI